MKLKKKHIIIGVILLSFVIIISTLYLLTFTDFIVKPKYIFSADYNNELKLRRMNFTERMNPFPTRVTLNVGNAFMRSVMLRGLSIKSYFIL